MIKDKVAVIMTVYKNDNVDYLRAALNSIVNQSLLEYKVFLGVDGPIPDTLLDLLKKFDVSNECFQLILFDDNKGLAVRLNQLIVLILNDGSFEFIARMDADDVCHLTRLEKQVDFLNSNLNVSVCGTACREFGAAFAKSEKTLPVDHEKLLDFSITRCPFIHPTVMFRAQVFIEGCFYPIDTKLTEDMALWFELLKKGYRFGNLNEVLLDYRLNEDTIKRRKGLSKAMSEIKIRSSNMVTLKRVTIKNVFLISVRIIFHLMPVRLVKLAYKFAR